MNITSLMVIYVKLFLNHRALYRYKPQERRSKMLTQINGVVQQKPIMLENCCLFVIKDNDDIYMVLSTDTQAGKDIMFVQKGQEMCIIGSSMVDNAFKGIFITREAHIKLEKISENYIT